MWRFEEKITEAFSASIAKTIDGKTWIRILVPFVTSLFVRSPEFLLRFETRISTITDTKNPEEMRDLPRLFEFHRLLASIISAEWIVLEVPSKMKVITNDQGYIPHIDPISRRTGFAIPIDSTHILVIIACNSRVVLTAVENNWWPVIKYNQISPDAVNSFNELMVSYASRFIIGSDEALINLASHYDWKQLQFGFEPGELGFATGWTAVVNDCMWDLLASSTEIPPNDWDENSFCINYENLFKGWHPSILFLGEPLKIPPMIYRSENEIITCIREISAEEFDSQYSSSK